MIAKFETLPNTQNGLVHQLVVQAENPVEEVALDLWADAFFENHQPKDSKNFRAMLLVKPRLLEPRFIN